MAISISAKLTTDNAEKYIMSIRLRSGGLSFSGYNPAASDTFFFQDVEFDRTKPYISSLKEFFFGNEFLNYSYKRIYIVLVSPEYTLVPSEIFEEKQKDGLMSFVFASPVERCLTNELKDEQVELVFGADEEVYEFCSRSLVNPRFVHYMAPSLILWKKQSRTRLPKQLYVVLHRRTIDIVCYAQGTLLFANTFGYEHSDDVLYYILYVWKQVGMDQQKDQLRIFGDPAFRNQITTTLRNYLQYIEPLEIPSEAYLLGSEVVQAPLDLIALSLCEL